LLSARFTGIIGRVPIAPRWNRPAQIGEHRADKINR
jgi:hypothetical protein